MQKHLTQLVLAGLIAGLSLPCAAQTPLVLKDSGNNLSIYNYNPAKDDYTLTLVGIAGMEPFTIPISYHGDTLFYHSEYSNNGKKMYNRTLNIFLSPSSYSYLIQSSDDGEHWKTDGMGKAGKK